MTLARLSNNWAPSFPSLLDKFFEGDLMDWRSSNYAATNTTLPAVNIKENDNEFELEVAAPGMQKEDFAVTYDNGRLTISSEKKTEQEEKKDEHISRREFSYQSFQRSFNIAEDTINAEMIEAKYNNGILHVKLPKREEAKPKPAKEIKIS